MKKLFEIDLNDYDEKSAVYRRPSVRGIIFRDKKRMQSAGAYP